MTEFERYMLLLVGASTMVNSLSILLLLFFWERGRK